MYLCQKVIPYGVYIAIFQCGRDYGSRIFVLLFFGADAIPGLARTIGKGMREFNKATADLKSEFEHHTSDIKQDFSKLTDKIEKE